MFSYNNPDFRNQSEMTVNKQIPSYYSNGQKTIEREREDTDTQLVDVRFIVTGTDH